MRCLASPNSLETSTAVVADFRLPTVTRRFIPGGVRFWMLTETWFIRPRSESPSRFLARLPIRTCSGWQLIRRSS